MRSVFVCAVVLQLLQSAQALADMGSIPFQKDVVILEPTQRALIACDGKEEILILSTDLQANKKTKVLEVMPLPSEPKVKKANVDIFKKATELINRKLPRMIATGGEATLGFGDGPRQYRRPAGRVTFHKRIGAHDISVTHVERHDGFVKWAQDYLRSLGVGTPVIPEALTSVVDEYIKENFKWFVFNVVSLTEKPVTKEAIQFRFKTRFLYYPLRITRTEKGQTSVKLLILTRGLFPERECLGLARRHIRLMHAPVTLSAREVTELSPEIHTMLGEPKSIKIRNWEIKGELASFQDDIILGDARQFLDHIRGKQRDVDQAGK